MYEEQKKERQPYHCSLDWTKSGGQIPWNAFAIREMSKTSWQTGKLRKEEDLGNQSLKGPIIPFGAQVEYLPNSDRDKARIHQFGKKVLPRIFIGYALIAVGISKGDILIADIEEVEKLDASEIYPRRLNAKEVLIYLKDRESVFPVTSNFHSR